MCRLEADMSQGGCELVSFRSYHNTERTDPRPGRNASEERAEFPRGLTPGTTDPDSPTQCLVSPEPLTDVHPASCSAFKPVQMAFL